nr:transposase domain-containing protein [Bradyrhizobium sp. JYMT SZCCT0428]
MNDIDPLAYLTDVLTVSSMGTQP